MWWTRGSIDTRGAVQCVMASMLQEGSTVSARREQTKQHSHCTPHRWRLAGQGGSPSQFAQLAPPPPPRCVVLGLVQILWSNLIEKQILSFRGPIVQLQSIKIQRSIISHPPTNPNNTNVQSIWKCLFLPPENPVRGGRISPPSACTLLWFGRSTPTYLTNELTN